jgi:hypothetical protein
MMKESGSSLGTRLIRNSQPFIWRTDLKVAVSLFIVAMGAIALAQEAEQKSGQIVSVLHPPSDSARVVHQEPVPVQEPAPAAVAGPVVAGDACCNVCCQPNCCCPPPRVPTQMCLVDPCGCSHQACVDVPACCAAEAPCVQWRDGVFGRQVATLCWTCCNFEAKVIVRRSGEVKVRD